MKIKGSESVVQQVTFEGDDHPSYGVISTFAWAEIASHLTKKNKDKVLSIKVDTIGLTVFWKDGTILGRKTIL